MYIIFVGSKGAGYFIDEEVKRLKGEIEFVESKAHISEQINTILPLAKKAALQLYMMQSNMLIVLRLLLPKSKKYIKQ